MGQADHQQPNILEMLTLAEFAQRMAVCPNTVRRWIRAKILKEGVNFMRVGHLYRFPWNFEVVKLLMQSLVPEPPPHRPGLQSRRNNRDRLIFKA